MGKNATRHICIVGPNRLQNELIASLLAGQEGEGFSCQIHGCVGKLPPAPAATPTLLLLDWHARELQDLFREKKAQGTALCNAYLTALFNVECGNGIAERALACGAKGAFFESDPPALFVKGVHALFGGEVWVPRDVLTRCYLNQARPAGAPATPAALLTGREVEILTLIAGGARNDQIAERLCISASTVKTHIYNIYKKINVPNRLQAALWAANHL